MFENQSNSSVIQTQDLFLMKEGDAADKIGRHLLIIAFYKKGAVIGNRFDKRQSGEQQWIKKIDSSSLIVGLGQYGAFESFCNFADSVKLSITSEILPERYVTLPVYDRFLTPMIRSAYEAGKPIALDIMYADLKSSNVKLVKFNGDTRICFGFGVLGGYSYQSKQAHVLTRKETKGKSEEEISEMMQSIFARGVRHPVKEAIEKMESFYGEKKCLGSMEEAMGAVREALFLCDPSSKKDTYEFTVFEKGALESIYIPRPEPVAVNIETPL